MDLLKLMDREHARIGRDLARCVDGWQTFRPERREHGAPENLLAFLAASETALWPALIAMSIDRASELAPAHQRMHACAANALRLCRLGNTAALEVLREVQCEWAQFAQRQADLHACLSACLEAGEMRQLAGLLQAELARRRPAASQPPNGGLRLLKRIQRSLVACAPESRALPTLTEAIAQS